MPLDEVDELVAAWRRERPDLPVEPMQIWSRVKRLAEHLDAARREAYAAHDLEAWEFDVMAALRRSGEPYQLTPGRLIRETRVTSGTMTNRVDRLVARRFVTREAHPDDGRGVLVGLTPAGRRRVDAALWSLLQSEEGLLAGVPDAQRAQLAAALRALLLAQSE